MSAAAAASQAPCATLGPVRCHRYSGKTPLGTSLPVQQGLYLVRQQSDPGLAAILVPRRAGRNSKLKPDYRVQQGRVKVSCPQKEPCPGNRPGILLCHWQGTLSLRKHSSSAIPPSLGSSAILTLKRRALPGSQPIARASDALSPPIPHQAATHSWVLRGPAFSRRLIV